MKKITMSGASVKYYQTDGSILACVGEMGSDAMFEVSLIATKTDEWKVTTEPTK